MDAHEPAVEVRLVRIAAGSRDLGERRSGEDHPARLGDAPRLLVAVRRQAVSSLEAAQKSRGRDAHYLRKIMEAQRFAAMGIEELPHLRGPRRHSAIPIGLV